jgi:hypothetical protein
VISAAKIAESVRLTQHEKPSGATHWTCRSMSRTVWISPAMVQRIWSGQGLRPHLVKTLKLSDDPSFQEKLIDVVGLYPKPPERARVLCMDEKTSVPALEATRLVADEEGPGRHDDQRLQEARHRHAVRCPQCPGWHRDRLGVVRHRREEFLKFIRVEDTEGPAQGPCGSCDSGQLRHSQAPERVGLARQASPVPPVVHPDLLVLAEPRRAMVA